MQAYERTRSHLSRELGLEPGTGLTTLQTEILTHDPELSSPFGSIRTDSLTAPRPATWSSSSAQGVRRPPAVSTPTIGRQQEIEEAKTLLDDPTTRLVTLIGPGGVGKTRVALAVADDMSPGILGGSVWVDLAGVARPDEVDSAIVRRWL